MSATQWPQVSGPVMGGVHGWPFAGHLDDLRARRYLDAAYMTRMVVQRPVGSGKIWLTAPPG